MHLMKKIPWLALSAGLLAGCAAGSSTPKPQASVIRGATPIPWDEIESILNPGQRNTLKSLKSTGYVVMHGWIEEDGTVKISRVIESHPDHDRDPLAVALGKKAVIHTPTSASKISPPAEVYVIFYGNLLEGDLALTFAKRPGFGASGRTGEGCYLAIVNY